MERYNTEATKLNIGCGPDVQPVPEWENIDLFAVSPDVKVVDMEQGELPYHDNQFEHIKATHVLEHIRNLIPLMNECHRVLRGGGTMYIEVPKFPHNDSVKDPDHKRFFVEETIWGYFCNYPANGLFKMYQIKPWKCENMNTAFDGSQIQCTLTPIKEKI